MLQNSISLDHCRVIGLIQCYINSKLYYLKAWCVFHIARKFVAWSFTSCQNRTSEWALQCIVVIQLIQLNSIFSTLARDSSWPLFICIHSTLALGAAGHGDWCGKWLQYFMLLTDYAGMKLWKKLTTKVHPKVQATLAEISFETAVTSELHNGWAPGISIIIILLLSSCRYCIVYDWIVNVKILIVSCAVCSIWGCITVLYCTVVGIPLYILCCECLFGTRSTCSYFQIPYWCQEYPCLWPWKLLSLPQSSWPVGDSHS